MQVMPGMEEIYKQIWTREALENFESCILQPEASPLCQVAVFTCDVVGLFVASNIRGIQHP